jgi:hypothetical protein
MTTCLRFFLVFGTLVFCFGSISAAPVSINQPAGFRLIIELQDGSKIIGKSGDDNFQFHSDVLGEMKLPLERIRSIACRPKTNSVQLATTNGDTLTAQFVTKVVRVETTFGSVKLPVNLIRRLTVSPAGKPGQIREGLVALWPGEANANDVAGTNNGVLVNGAGFATGEVGQAFSFDGVSSYVSIPDSPSLDTFVSSITIETWIKMNQLTADWNWEGIVTKGKTSWRLQVTARAKTVYFAATGVGPHDDLYGSRNIYDGQWHHVTGVYDGTNMFLYVDGTLDVSQPATGSISQNSSPVCIGANAIPGVGLEPEYFFNGLIDEVSIYNRALTASEIQADYEAGKGSN